MNTDKGWMNENPFAPHSPATPDVFVNRQRELDLVFGQVKAVQRGNVAVNGPLGIGKTSLLHYVADPAVASSYDVAPPHYAIVYVDVHSVTPFSSDRFWRRVARLLSRSGAVGLDSPIQRLIERPAIDVTDVEELLDAAADREAVLVLLLDEFEWALQADSREAEAESRNFLAQMASLARRAPRVMSIVLATEQPLAEATRVIESWRGSPFPTVFTSATLRPLDRKDANTLIDRAYGGDPHLVPEDERNLLFSSSRGQPAALQAAAFSLCQARLQGLGSEAKWEEARREASRALDVLQPAFEHVTPQASSGEATVAGDRQDTDDGSGLTIDARSGDVLVNGLHVESLTALEYSLLKLLYDNPGRLCSKDEIIRHVWGDEFLGEVDASRVEKLVSRLRRKIESVPSRPQYVRTVRGRGYRFVP
jgi:hypothetical protein